MNNELYLATNENGNSRLFENMPHRVISNMKGKSFWQDGNDFSFEMKMKLTEWKDNPIKIDKSKLEKLHKEKTSCKK